MNQYWKMGITIILTALITGSGVYLWQQNKMLKNNQLLLMKEVRSQRENQPIAPVEKKQVTIKEEPAPAPTSNDAKVLPPAETSDSTIVYQDKELGIAFTTQKACGSYYSIRPAQPGGQELKHYDVYIPGSKDWAKNTPWYSYSVFTVKTYNAINPDEMPGRPEMVLKLSSGNLLTRWFPNDGPNDSICTIKVENL